MGKKKLLKLGKETNQYKRLKQKIKQEILPFVLLLFFSSTLSTHFYENVCYAIFFTDNASGN